LYTITVAKILSFHSVLRKRPKILIKDLHVIMKKANILLQMKNRIKFIISC
jgi:hypothetical protein